MRRNLATFARRHPLLRDALLWAIPALLLGLVLRGLLLSYQPFAYWGSDSDSYYNFAERVLDGEKWVLREKRRYVYPIFLVPLSLLPGATLQWLAWAQHALGVLTLIPLAYVVRKSFVGWRVLIVPITLLYASLPMIVWYEHELLGEAVFYAAMVWALAGWAAWTSQTEVRRARLLWWWFFAAYAVILLIKPSGRFILPGLLLALLAVRAWRTLGWVQLAPLAAVVALALQMGTDKQSSWLLYSSSFPLTRLETPLHAAYKAEIRDLAVRSRTYIGSYYLMDHEPKGFLKYPEKHPDRPLWAALSADDDLRARIYRDLALEGIRARPDLFLYLSAQKILYSCQLVEFKIDRLHSGYFARQFEDAYDQFNEEHPRGLERLFGVPKNEPPPAYAEFRKILSVPGTAAERWLKVYFGRVQKIFALVRWRMEWGSRENAITGMRVAPWGWLFLAGALLSCLRPYRTTIGLWMIIAVGYTFGVFLLGSANTRFFAFAWPPIILASAVPLDLLFRALSGQLRQPKILPLANKEAAIEGRPRA